VDTSGTAKALVASFQKLGPQFELEDIVKVRDAPQQRAMGVPGACACACACGCFAAALLLPRRLICDAAARGLQRST
jgi:hypothetical protein